MFWAYLMNTGSMHIYVSIGLNEETVINVSIWTLDQQTPNVGKKEKTKHGTRNGKTTIWWVKRTDIYLLCKRLDT